MEKSQINPRARTDGLLVQELGDEVLIYDLDRQKAHCLNKTAALIWKLCDGEKSIAQIAGVLSVHQEAPFHQEAVRFALAQLKKTNLLTESTARDSEATAISRREVIRKIGIAAAVGLPLVTSVIAPRAAEALTPCITSGHACSPGQCCTGSTCVDGFCT